VEFCPEVGGRRPLKNVITTNNHMMPKKRRPQSEVMDK
jgi:hypothetical protein